jgi:hypothetical protein
MPIPNMIKNVMKKSSLMLLVTVLLVLVAMPAFADLRLDDVQFDPAIITAGDTVDVVVQYHDEATPFDEEKIGDTEYTFRVLLEPEDTLAKEYITVLDADGDDVHGRIFAGGFYNKRFRIKIDNDAVPGDYELTLKGQWYHAGKPETSYEYVRFVMPVKKEGILLDVSTLTTEPAEVRPGDNYVVVKTDIQNAGEKDAKSVEVNLLLPEGVEASYTNNNRVWIGRVNTGANEEATFYVDIAENMSPGIHEIVYLFEYMDLDSNPYNKTVTTPFRIKGRPYLEIVDSKGEGLAGAASRLYVTVKNTGTESAEAVDVRLLKQNAQPFHIDVRSDYIGELEPGETGVAVFDIDVTRDATIKTHSIKVLIRSKGDSDEGDDTIYTYNRRAQFDVTDVAPNTLKVAGGIGTVLVILLIGTHALWKRRKK